MMRSLALEDFAAPQTEDRTAQAEARLHGYEEGYKAGWDDASAAEAQAQDRISAEFAKTLGDMSFSYHEARSHILSGLSPLLVAMVDRVLPTLAARGFAQTVADFVLPLAEDATSHPLELRVSPENRAALAALLADGPDAMPLALQEDETLGPGQALLDSPRQCREIDIDAMLAAVQGALDDFLTIDEEEKRRHG